MVSISVVFKVTLPCTPVAERTLRGGGTQAARMPVKDLEQSTNDLKSPKEFGEAWLQRRMLQAA
eukprot:1140994-Pelagomonas_calceolata.AAC.2